MYLFLARSHNVSRFKKLVSASVFRCSCSVIVLFSTSRLTHNWFTSPLSLSVCMSVCQSCFNLLACESRQNACSLEHLLTTCVHVFGDKYFLCFIRKHKFITLTDSSFSLFQEKEGKTVDLSAGITVTNLGADMCLDGASFSLMGHSFNPSKH